MTSQQLPCCPVASHPSLRSSSQEMNVRAFSILYVVLVVGPFCALAQPSPSNLAQCLVGADPWSFNSVQQSPCEVAADLAGVCSPGFGLPPLPEGDSYLGPQAGRSNECICSTVYYSLLSACALCQNRAITRWSTYKTNCTTVYLSVFIDPIPSDTRVPHYAYLDVNDSDTFNATLAQAALGPESSSLPTPTSASTLPTSSSTAVSGSATGTTKHQNQAGAIAGGTVGGILGLALLVVLLYILYKRMQPRETGTYDPPLAGSMEGPQAGALRASLKQYDPNDPSTFPEPIDQRMATPVSYPTNVYTGRPEV